LKGNEADARTDLFALGLVFGAVVRRQRSQGAPDGRLLYIKDDRPGLFARSLAGDPAANPEERLVEDIQGPIAYFASGRCLLHRPEFI
jgi:hypothetical protein